MLNEALDSLFSLPAPQLARRLLGMEIVVHHPHKTVGGIIIETEAYTAADPASHSFKGLKRRNSAMFERAGTIYIYRIYGRHHCFNIVCGNCDGQAVLLRALLPTHGIEHMMKRRTTQNTYRLTNGPANMFQALGMDTSYNGCHISETPIIIRQKIDVKDIARTPRIGITKGKERLWRFVYKPKN